MCEDSQFSWVNQNDFPQNTPTPHLFEAHRAPARAIALTALGCLWGWDFGVDLVGAKQLIWAEPHDSYTYPSWWLNQTIWKILVKMGSSSPNRDEHKKYLKPPPSIIYIQLQGGEDEETPTFDFASGSAAK